MFHVYCGREDLNREKFIYENIKGNAVVLVPDQYTIQAERDAFLYTGKKALMDTEILSFSRLADRVFSQAGGGKTPLIDRQGRHMLLTGIIRKLKDRLSVYGAYSGNVSFIEMANDFISETKQFGRGPEDLFSIAGSLPRHRYLRRKLEDMALIFEEYEKRIDGKYTDTEDRITRMTERMDRSQTVLENSFWIYGFDYIAPKTRSIIVKLAELAPEVNLVMTNDRGCADDRLFEVTSGMIREITDAVREAGVGTEISQISDAYREKRPDTIRTIERELFALPVGKSDAEGNVKLTTASDFASEAESAAAEITRLVREEGLRYRDIAVICNDLSGRGRICKRVFAEYGLELFLDEKRGIMDQPAVEFVIALLDVMAYSYRPDDVMRLMKTGLSPVSEDDADLFESYVRCFHIRGRKFREPFEKTGGIFDEEEAAKAEEIRKRLADSLEGFAENFKKDRNAAARTKVLYDYLAETIDLPGRINEQIEKDAEAGFAEAASEAAQVWNVIVRIMDQMVEVMGEEDISLKDYAAVFESGCRACEIGLIPPVVDGIVMGTMQRTRTGSLRALFVLGANDGVLPAGVDDEKLFSEEERAELDKMAGEGKMPDICKSDAFKVNEENLAIYRNLSKPEDELWISCSLSDMEGKPVRRSHIFDTVSSILPKIPVGSDISASGDWLAMTARPEAAAAHLGSAVQEGMRSGTLDEKWLLTAEWMKENDRKTAGIMKAGYGFSPVEEPIPADTALKLYTDAEDLSLSPSRLEKFAKCPFSHFVRYGLRPFEPDDYTVGARQLGDMYHLCLRRMGELLSNEGLDVSDPKSGWQTITKSECDAAVDAILEKEMSGYKEGLFQSSGSGRYRQERLRRICREVCWTVIDHVRRGSIEKTTQETRFSRGNSPLDPVICETPYGRVYVEGIIDRVDYLNNGMVKVIDYKSGSDSYREKEAVSGWKLQLFVYLKAACGGGRVPAGAYYFHVAEPMGDISGVGESHIKEEIGEKIRENFRMDGFTLAEEDTVKEIDSTFGESESSSVITASRKKDGDLAKKAGKLLSRPEMEKLIAKVDKSMESFCSGLRGGRIEAAPKKNGSISACTYCDYSGICKFDPMIEGCRREEITADLKESEEKTDE